MTVQSHLLTLYYIVKLPQYKGIMLYICKKFPLFSIEESHCLIFQGPTEFILLPPIVS